MDLPVGWYEMGVGPITDPNLSWLLLGRALLHAKRVVERNHARREELVGDAQEGAHLADAIDTARRRRLDGTFRRLRRGRDVAAEERTAHDAELASRLDPSAG